MATQIRYRCGKYCFAWQGNGNQKAESKGEARTEERRERGKKGREDIFERKEEKRTRKKNGKGKE